MDPNGIAQHPVSCDLYVSVSCGVNVIEYSNWGHVKVVIGGPADYGLQNSDFSVSKFGDPQGIVFINEREMLYADSQNNRSRLLNFDTRKTSSLCP